MSAEAELEKTDIYSVVSAVLMFDDLEFIDFIIGNGSVFPRTVYQIIRLWDKVFHWFCELPDSDSIEAAFARLRQEDSDTGQLAPDFQTLLKSLNPGNASILLVIARRKEDEYTTLFYEELLKFTNEETQKILAYLKEHASKEPQLS